MIYLISKERFYYRQVVWYMLRRTRALKCYGQDLSKLTEVWEILLIVIINSMSCLKRPHAA